MVEPNAQVAVEKPRTVGVCSGITHEQSDLAICDGGEDLVRRIR